MLAIGLFVPDLAQSLRDHPFVLAVMMLLWMGIALVGYRLETSSFQEKKHERASWALCFALLVPFIFIPAGLIVYLIATAAWGVGEKLVLPKLFRRSTAAASEVL